MLLAVLFVLMDYLVDFRPSKIQPSYRFALPDLPFDQPVWLKQDNLSVVLIKRSTDLLETLKQASTNLQDPDSKSSRQPDYAINQLRSRHETYFVGYGRGTDLECPLQASSGFTLRETCGSARYDFAGRALTGKKHYQNLTIPDYTFNDDFTVLTIKP